MNINDDNENTFIDKWDNLEVGSQVNLLSNDILYNNQKATVDRISKHSIVFFLDNGQILEIDITKNKNEREIYDFELIKNSDKLEEEIELREESDDEEIEIGEEIDITLEFEIKEEDLVCSLDKGLDCLITELMRLKENKSIKDIQRLSSNIIENILELNENKKRKLDHYFFVNSNFIPIVKLTKYKYIHDDRTDVIYKNFELEIKELSKIIDKYKHNSYANIGNNYDYFYNYVNKNMESFKPSSSGLRLDLECDSEMIEHYNNERINIMRGVGTIYNYFNDEQSYKKEIFTGEQISIIGLFYNPNPYKFNTHLDCYDLKDIYSEKNKRKKHNHESFYKYKLHKESILEIKDIHHFDFKHYINKILCFKPDVIDEHILNKITPSIKDILKLKENKHIFSLDDLYKNNELLNVFKIILEDEPYENARLIYSFLTENIKKKNIPFFDVDYKLQYDTYIKENEFNSIFINRDLLNKDHILSIYGQYPYYLDIKDDNESRFLWLYNQFDKGSIYFNYFLNDKQIEDGKVNPNLSKPISYIIISNVYYDKIEDDRLRDNEYVLLVKEDISIYQVQILNKKKTWIKIEENLNKLVFIPNTFIEEKKLFPILNKKKLNFIYNIDFEAIDSKVEIDNIVYYNEFTKDIMEQFTENQYIEKKNYMDYLGILKQKKIQREYIPEKTMSELEKEIKKIKQIEDEYKRDRLIEHIIKNKLRHPNEREDYNFFYCPITNKKILSKHWELKCKLTLPQFNREDILNKMILQYGEDKKGSGEWICKTDGDILGTLDYDSFEGFEEEGNVNIIRETLDYKTDKDLFYSKEVSNILRDDIKIKIHSYLNELIDYLDIVDRNSISKYILELTNHIYHFSQKKLETEYRHLKIKISKKEFMNKNSDKISLFTAVYYGVFFQTHIPIFQPPRIKNCTYSIKETPYTLKDTITDTFIDYYSCILYNNNIFMSKYFNSQISQDKFYEKIRKYYKEIGNEDYIQKRYNTWLDYLDTKKSFNIPVWHYYKPQIEKYYKEKNNIFKTQDFIHKRGEEPSFFNVIDFSLPYKIVEEKKSSNTKEFYLTQDILVEEDRIPIYPSKLNEYQIKDLLSMYSVSKKYLGKRKLFNKYNICLYTGEKKEIPEKYDISILLQAIKNKSKIQLSDKMVQLFTFEKILYQFDSVLSNDIIKQDNVLKNIKQEYSVLFKEWDEEDKNKDNKHNLFYKLKNIYNTSIDNIKYNLISSTFTFGTLPLSDIEELCSNIFLDYDKNLYLNAILSLMSYMNIIISKHSSFKEIKDKKNKYVIETINAITEFENNIIALFSNVNMSELKLMLNHKIHTIREIYIFLKNLYAKKNIQEKTNKLELTDIFELSRYLFYSILSFLIINKEEETTEMNSFLYLFLEHLNKSYKETYFTKEQINNKFIEEREEEANRTKQRIQVMSDNERNLDTEERKMGIGFYAKGKLDYQRGFNK